MTPTKLRAARSILGLSQAEAAELIGDVAQRSWSYWEDEQGGRKAPADVITKVQDLLNKRKEHLKFISEKMAEYNEQSTIAVIYYHHPEDCGGVLNLRFTQSLARTLAIDFGCGIVSFNKENYIKWLINEKESDSSQARSNWAAHYYLENN